MLTQIGLGSAELKKPKKPELKNHKSPRKKNIQLACFAFHLHTDHMALRRVGSGRLVASQQRLCQSAKGQEEVKGADILRGGLSEGRDGV